MKKVLALLCVLSVLVTLCACRKSKTTTKEESYLEGTETTDDGSNGSENDGYTASDGAAASDNQSGVNSGTGKGKAGNPLGVDLKGATVTVYQIDPIFTPDAKKSKTDQAKAEMIQKLQKELNCKLDVKVTDDDKLRSLATASAAGGKAIAQIISPSIHKTGYYISANLVADMGKISSMDLSKSYMNVAGLPEATHFGNGKYAVAADASVAHGMVYNKRILKELGYADDYIYNLVDSGKWTYSEFRKLAKSALRDLDGAPGMSGEDQWGVAVMDRDTGVTADLLASANTPMIRLSGGKLVSNMKNANIAKIANLIRETYKIDGIEYQTGGAYVTGTKAHDAFKNGKVLMEYTTSEVMYLYANMKDVYGFVPVPKYDGAKTYASALDWNYKALMIPAGLSAEEQYNAGAVVQAYMYLMQDIYEVKKKEYVNRYFCDDKSGENFLIALKGVTVHPAQCYAKINETILTGTYRVFWDYIREAKSVSAAVESTDSSLGKALDDLNKKIKDK